MDVEKSVCCNLNNVARVLGERCSIISENTCLSFRDDKVIISNQNCSFRRAWLESCVVLLFCLFFLFIYGTASRDISEKE